MLIFALIILGIISRLLPHFSQFTAILAVSFIGGIYLKRNYALMVPLVIMVVSDVILGFHDTMFYTWGSMLLISFLGLYVQKQKTVANIALGSVVSALIFFVVTNFGAWASPLYPHTLQGLKDCYILAIPFFRTTFFSTLIYTAVLYVVIEKYLTSSRVSGKSCVNQEQSRYGNSRLRS